MINCSGKAKIKHDVTGEVYEIDSDSLIFGESERFEENMGSRVTYTANFEHDQLGELFWSLWEYPIGTEEHRETNVGAHIIIEDIMFDLDNDDAERRGKIEHLVDWFHQHYVNPAENTPRDIEEGEYLWHGSGPHEALDVLSDFFPDEEEYVLQEAVKRIQSDGTHDWASRVPEEEYSDDNDPTKLADELNAIISSIPEPRGYPQFSFGDDNILHMVTPLDQQIVTSNTELLEELRKAAFDLQKSLVHTNAHTALKVVVDAYCDALFNDEISITKLYACGVRLYNADQKIKREIQDDVLPALPPEVSIHLGTVQDLHGPYVMADERGKKLVQDASEYNTSSQQAEELRRANQKIAVTIDRTPTLFGENIREHVLTVVGDVGKGPAPERSDQAATTTITNVVIEVLKRVYGRTINRIIGIASNIGIPIAAAMDGSIDIAIAWLFLIEIIPHIKVFASQAMRKLSSMKAISDALKRISSLNKWRPKQKNKAETYKISDGDTWEIYKDNANEWRWRRTASNGEIVGAAVQGYVNKADCISNAERHRMTCTPS